MFAFCVVAVGSLYPACVLGCELFVALQAFETLFVVSNSIFLVLRTPQFGHFLDMMKKVRVFSLTEGLKSNSQPAFFPLSLRLKTKTPRILDFLIFNKWRK